MYFFAILKDKNTDPFIPCGSDKVINVDGRYSLDNQYYIACDHLQKRFNNLYGIACYKNISDKRPTSSVKINSVNGISFDSFVAFDHSDTSIFY